MSAPILYCHCQYARIIPPERKDAVLNGLLASGQDFEAVPDLCEMAARRDPRLAELAQPGARIAACYPRAVRWLFHGAGITLPEDASVLNMRSQEAPELLDALLPTKGESS